MYFQVKLDSVRVACPTIRSPAQHANMAKTFHLHRAMRGYGLQGCADGSMFQGHRHIAGRRRCRIAEAAGGANNLCRIAGATGGNNESRQPRGRL